MKQLIAIALAAGALVAVPACSDSDPTGAAPVEPATVNEAKAAVWPPADGEEPETLDTRLTRANYVAVLDMSGSMGEDRCSGRFPDKAQAARAALDAWLDNVDRKANLGLVVFDSRGVRVAVPLGRDNRDRFRRAVKDTYPDGGTPLLDAVNTAHEQLATRARYQQGYGTYRLVVITDGQHTAGQDPTPAVNTILDNPANPVEIHTIGFCIERSALNQPGRTIYRSAKNPKELAAGLESVLAESQSFDTIKEFEANEAQ